MSGIRWNIFISYIYFHYENLYLALQEYLNTQPNLVLITHRSFPGAHNYPSWNKSLQKVWTNELDSILWGVCNFAWQTWMINFRLAGISVKH